MTNKYAEGYPGARYYGGCEFVDEVERLCIERARALFGADHANVQPHSGTQANMAVFQALLSPGDTILAMSLSQGGHLSHGYSRNFSGHVYRSFFYGLDRETERIDMREVERLAMEHRPKLIVCGASAYPRAIDFEAFRAVADKVGAFLLADIAHVAGLVAAKLHPDPVPHCHVVTSTTHKTMRGPRGGMILSRKDLARKIESAIFPGIQGGPLMHVIAGKAVALKEAMQPEFKEYQKQIVANAAAMAKRLSELGHRLVSGGTDNHLMLVDLRQTTGMSGKDAEKLLDKVGITLNKNLVPFDPRPPAECSGIRIGTPAVTTRGMKEAEMEKIAEMIDATLRNPGDDALHKKLRRQTLELCERFPIYLL
jgi:glycine hydroxymethyltransferase